MVDRACAKLDGEWDRSLLRELVAVQPQREPRVSASLQVPLRPVAVESAPLEEDVGRLRELRRLRKDLREHEVEVRVRIVVLGRHRVGTEPGRDATLGLDRTQRRELGLAVEPVARLGFEGRRSRMEHPGSMPAHRVAEPILAGCAGRLDGGQDAATRCVQLLVARAARAQFELTGTAPCEARMRVTVDEPRKRAQAASIELLDVSAERTEVGHAPHLDDPSVLAQDVCVFHDLDASKIGAPQRRLRSRGRDCLHKVANEQARRSGRRAHSPRTGGIGSSRPCSAAASTAPSYPASACRRTPIAGSVVSTRSRRSAIPSVPSATTTMPAWIAFPIPTAPPWWTLTQVAPAATLTCAFRIGQSAIASEPSFIASVSRYGEATEPESK